MRVSVPRELDGLGRTGDVVGGGLNVVGVQVVDHHVLRAVYSYLWWEVRRWKVGRLKMGRLEGGWKKEDGKVSGKKKGLEDGGLKSEWVRA